MENFAVRFNDFQSLLPKIRNLSLPGHAAHLQMVPQVRRQMLAPSPGEQTRDAAVLILIFKRAGSARLLLIRRNAYKGVHSSQVALPGGKREFSDADFSETALRETWEEVGISPEMVHVERELSRIYIAPSRFFVYPFVGVCTSEPNFVPDAREVAAVIEVGLSDLLTAAVQIETVATTYDPQMQAPGFRFGQEVVWGATAMMLNEFKELLNKAMRT